MTEYEQEYLEFCLEAVQHGYIIMSGARQMLKYQDRQVPLSRALWNYWYPDDPVLSTEVIHHKNGNRLDNGIDNLEKLNAGDHMKLHTESLRQLRKEGKPYPYKTRKPKKEEIPIKYKLLEDFKQKLSDLDT